VLNAWAARLMGPSSDVRLPIERVADVSTPAGEVGTVLEIQELRLSDLGLAALDAVYMAPLRSGEPMNDIEALALYLGQQRFANLAPGERLRLNPRRAANWAARELSLSEFGELATRTRQLLAGARALDARDLSALAQAPPAGWALDEFERRASTAEKLLTAQAAALSALLKTPAVTALDKLRTAMLAMLGWGLAAAVPPPPQGSEVAQRAALLAQADTLLRAAQQRIDRMASLRQRSTTREPTASSTDPRMAAALTRLRNVFGEDFLALPRFNAPNATELRATMAASTALQGGDAIAVYPWLAQVQRVRPGVARLSASLHAADSVGTGERMHLTVGQLPHVAHDRWIGLPFDPPHACPAGVVSLVLQAQEKLDLAQPMVGLLIDEWVETVPSTFETTGIAFQSNPPDASAPQALLLAVPSAPGQAWTAWNLHRVLMETWDLARLRTIDAEALDTALHNPVPGAEAVGDVAHFLPALYFPLNLNADTPSLDFGPLTRG
jgi:hypothetical protein